MQQKILVFLLSIIASGLLKTTAAETLTQNQINAYLFESATCSHCKAEKAFLTQIAPKYKNVKINSFEISSNKNNLQLMTLVGKELGIDTGGVPFLVVGDKTLVGFGSAETTGVKIESMLNDALNNPPKDVVSEILAANPYLKVVNKPISAAETVDTNPSTEKKPVFEIKLDPSSVSSLPLPLFTFFIALMDGFNPCAMWALLFLISILLGMKDRRRMWLLGGTFIFISGLVYFLFLAAWLNFFLVIGYTLIIRYIVGAFAVGLGVYYLYDYFKNKGGCAVTSNEKRKGWLEKIKNIVINKNLFVSVVGMVVLAASVNLVELLCSAGLPAVYTKVLSISNLQTWEYYLYLIFYIFIFMLDDLVVFIGAMITLRAFGIKNKWAKYSHLAGGIIVLLIGLALIFRPELLSFK